MSVHPTTKIRSRRAALATSIAVLASLASAGVANAAPVVDYVAGNPSCADVASSLKSLKIDPVPQGRTSRSAFTIDVSGRVFDWSSTQGVDVVIVKGGPNALVYRFDTEQRAGRGLHAPVNPENGQYYGLSHISFCHDDDAPPPPPPPAKKDPPAEKPAVRIESDDAPPAP